MAQITLRQLIEKAESEDKIDIAAGNFDTMSNFLFYFDAHYKPILEKLDKEWVNEEGAKRFIAGYLLEIFKQKGVNYEKN